MHVCTYLASMTRISLTGPVLIPGHEFTWGIIGLHRFLTYLPMVANLLFPTSDYPKSNYFKQAGHKNPDQS